MSVIRTLLLWGSENEWLREHVPNMSLARRAVRRFMPGEDLDAALEAAERFEEDGIHTVFTNLGENVDAAAEAAEVADHYSGALRRIDRKGFGTEISIKLTHVGLDVDEEVAYRNVVELAECAAQCDNYLWIDMESSSYTDVTLDLVERVLETQPNVGVCLQAYLYRTEDDMDRMVRAGAGIRLVKGAYDEPADIAFPRKEDVDENFYTLALRLLPPHGADGNRIAFATHDRTLVERICERADGSGVERSAYEFQMLYGIERALQRELSDEGFGVRVLISYGEGWYPWYMRRLAERPANLLFALRHVFPN